MTAAATTVRRFRVDAGGFDIVGDDRGPVDAPPILLLAGDGQTRHSWRPLAPA